MKILLINKYWRHAGGVEVHAFQVAKWLESQGHTVIPFAMKEPDTIPNDYISYFPDQVDFRGGNLRTTTEGVLRATFSRDARSLLRQLIADQKPDGAYVLHTYHQLGTALLNELEDAGVPSVLSIHDYKMACPNYRLFSEATSAICTTCLDTKFGFLTAPIAKRCWNNSAAAGVALSLEALTTRLRRSYTKPATVIYLNSLQKRAALHAGIPESRLRHVPHPVELFEDRSLPKDDSPFLFIGRLVPEKGVDVLIRAAARNRQPVIIAGEGRSRDELEALSVELEAPVEFIGSIDRNAVVDHLRSSKALIVPSTWHEVSPLVVYEAISHDVPVIASAVGGMVDQLGDDRGFLVPPGEVEPLSNEMLRIATDPDAAADRSQRARTYARTGWSPAAWSENMADAFRAAGIPL